MARNKRDETESDIFAMAAEFERKHPGIVEAMELVGVSMEKYEASLNAVYRPRTLTSNSTEDLNFHME